MAFERTKVFQARLTEQEAEMIRALAEAEGSTGSQVVRALVRRAYAERFPEKKKTKR